MKITTTAIAVFLVLFLLCTAVTITCEELRCSNCGKVLSDTYWLTDNQKLCTACYRALSPHCIKCGTVPKGKYWKTRAGIICDSCYQKTALRCTYCRKILQGHYYSSDEGNVCEACLRIHGRKCAVCGRLLKGQYKTYKDIDRHVCMECEKKYRHCRNCGIPAADDKLYLVEKGFVLCPRCAESAVLDAKKLIPLFREAKVLVRKVIGIEASVPESRIRLVDSAYLAEEIKKTGEYTPKTGIAGLHTSKAGISTIYILRGMSPDQCLETLAHEYAHAWQASRCPPDQDLVFKEGFAEWVSYRVLVHRKLYILAENKLREKDPIYGEGLKKMLQVEQRLGKSETVTYARKEKSFGKRPSPSGSPHR